MAGTPVAALQNGFVAHDGSANQEPESRLLGGIRAERFLQTAAVFYVGALVLALLEIYVLPLPFVLLTGLAVTLLALRGHLPSVPTAQRSAKLSSVSEPADLSPAQKGSEGPPTLLPFIGERITLNPNTAQLEGLANRGYMRRGRAAAAAQQQQPGPPPVEGAAPTEPEAWGPAEENPSDTQRRRVRR